MCFVLIKMLDEAKEDSMYTEQAKADEARKEAY
jgi:hypothetical protein